MLKITELIMNKYVLLILFVYLYKNINATEIQGELHILQFIFSIPNSIFDLEFIKSQRSSLI